MPSFAKKTVVDDVNPLASLWKDHPNAEPMKDLVTDSRNRAVEILRDLIPAKITHLRALLAQQNDPSSLLYSGHLESGDYLSPRMVQPGHVTSLVQQSVYLKGRGLNPEDLKPGERIVLPDEIVLKGRSSGSNSPKDGSSTPDSEMSEDTLISEGTKYDSLEDGNELKGSIGQRWFEVVPRNKVQTDLVSMLLKEHEVLHRMMTDLKLWLALETPLIEDGNSFGVEVQEHLVRECDNAFKRSNMLHNGMRQHHTDRIKLIADWVRYPNVLDIPVAIANSDRFDNFLAKSYLNQQLIAYAGLMNKFQKNWDKVINPKGNSGSNAGGMY